MEDTFEDEVDQGKIIVCVCVRVRVRVRVNQEGKVQEDVGGLSNLHYELEYMQNCRYWPGHFLISHNRCLWAEVQTDNV